MQGLYPIIRRRRVPLIPLVDSPAGGGQTGRGQGVAGGGTVTSPPGLPSDVKSKRAAAPLSGDSTKDSES